MPPKRASTSSIPKTPASTAIETPATPPPTERRPKRAKTATPLTASAAAASSAPPATPTKPMSTPHSLPPPSLPPPSLPPPSSSSSSSSSQLTKKQAFAKFKSRAGPVAPGTKPLPQGSPDCLAGLSFVFTGEMQSTSREQGKSLVERHGGRVVTAPSGKTSYMVVGNDSGPSKLKKARDLGIPEIDEDQLFEMIAKSGK